MSKFSYRLCPGGSGKKIKFCCADLVNELEQIDRMFVAEQRVACLDYVEQLEAKRPGRACLLTCKATLQRSLGKTDQAQESLNQILDSQPANAEALAQSAVLAMQKLDWRSAVDLLQQSLEAAGGEMAPTAIATLSSMATLLAIKNRIYAGMAHVMQELLRNPTSTQARNVLAKFVGDDKLSPSLKDAPRPLEECPSDAPWAAEYDSICSLVRFGKWRMAEQELLALTESVTDWPPLWRTLGHVRGYLADYAGAVEALRRYAAMNVSLSDAVEAEALAQLLDEPGEGDFEDIVRVEFRVADLDKVADLLRGGERFRAAEWSIFASDEDRPRPRETWELLEFAVPGLSDDLKISDLPLVQAVVELFGRETDREARLELEAYRVDLQAAESCLREVVGAELGERGAETVSSRSRLPNRIFRAIFRAPEESSIAQHERWANEFRQRQVLEAWPRFGLPQLGGQSVMEAAQDPANHARVLATMLNLQHALDSAVVAIELDGVAEQLGLPRPVPSLERQDLDEIPLALLHLVDFRALSTPEVEACYLRASYMRARLAIATIAEELLGRDDLSQPDIKMRCCAMLGSLQSSTQSALDWVGRARENDPGMQGACAHFDLDELRLRALRGEGDDIVRLCQHIQRRHAKEPGVMAGLSQILDSFGLLDDDGSHAHPGSADQGGLVLPEGAAEPGKIWTPDSEQPAGQKSALWTPGME